ncbi:MAG TPA: GNAT family N-acetyltransferase [Phycisphaerae bacterium]|nr:GNAT family N-acetyltransferase [Phycisphaerae bacterium]
MAADVRKRGLDDPEVAGFLARHETYLFQEPVWGRVLSSLGHEAAYYCLEEGNRIVLAQPVLHMRLGFFHLLYGGLPYGFAVGDLSRYQELAAGTARTARAEGAHRVRLSRCAHDPDVAPAGYAVHEHVQHMLHFGGRSEEEVWQGFKRRVRHDVRVAMGRGVVVRDAVGEEDRDTIFRMYCRTMARNRTYIVWPKNLIEEVWRLLVEPGRGEMMISWHDGEPLAAMITFYGGRRCFAFLGASTGAKRNLRPNDILFWEAMKRAVARGCEDFDFMMSSCDDKALIAFKDKWGAERRPFLFFEKDLSHLRCLAWNVAFRAARTPPGGAVLRWLRR